MSQSERDHLMGELRSAVKWLLESPDAALLRDFCNKPTSDLNGLPDPHDQAGVRVSSDVLYHIYRNSPESLTYEQLDELTALPARMGRTPSAQAFLRNYGPTQDTRVRGLLTIQELAAEMKIDLAQDEATTALKDFAARRLKEVKTLFEQRGSLENINMYTMVDLEMLVIRPLDRLQQNGDAVVPELFSYKKNPLDSEAARMFDGFEGAVADLRDLEKDGCTESQAVRVKLETIGMDFRNNVQKHIDRVIACCEAKETTRVAGIG